MTFYKVFHKLRHKWYFIVLFIVIVYLLWPSRYASHYNYISYDKILDNLVYRTTKNLTIFHIKRKCNYENLINENEYFYNDINLNEIHNPDEILNGGEYYPPNCSPQFSTAIIVIYRNREEQLKKFLTYMHNFLRKQEIHYRIFVVEQYDNGPFNRAKLFNIGSIFAKNLDFPCLILHDVDILPMNLGQIYACTKKPRHLCSSLDIFRFNLPYSSLFGGVTAIEMDVFQKINGLSNLFKGWGGEDDDFFLRLHEKKIEICRFQPDYSRYIMMKHKEEAKNKDRVFLLKTGVKRFHTDGLNSLTYVEKGYKLKKYYTHILVEV